MACLLPEFRGIDTHRADYVALAAGRTFIKGLEEVLSFRIRQATVHETAQVAHFAPGSDAFTGVLGIDRTPDLAVTAPCAGLQFNKLSAGQSLGDLVALCFEMSGQ